MLFSGCSRKFRIFGFGSLPILFLSIYAFAGGDSSSGGGGMVCRDDHGTILSAELLDLWEVQLSETPFRVVRNDAPVAAQLERIYLKVKRSFGQFSADQLRERVTHVRSRVREIPKNIEISPPTDALNDLIQRGCRLEGIARYSDRKDVLYIDPQIIQKMSNTDIAALWVHEAIYWERRNGISGISITEQEIGQGTLVSERQETVAEQNSIKTREFVGRLFSDYEWAQPPKDVDADYVRCAKMRDGQNFVYYLEKDRKRATFEVSRFVAQLMPIRTIEKQASIVDSVVEYLDRPLSEADRYFAQEFLNNNLPGTNHFYLSPYGTGFSLTVDRGIQVELRFRSKIVEDPLSSFASRRIQPKAVRRGDGGWFNKKTAFYLNPETTPICERLNTKDVPLPW